MASSNRHWPSMFKSKPQHQWQHDNNSPLLPSSCHRSSPYPPGCEERTPEPKPRWNPKPEQIRILEAIFNSGMVNPPRDEIRKIRAQLQEYGQVGDANVFYWFQNRKSRSKHKLRLLHGSKQSSAASAANAAASSSSSSNSSSPSPRGQSSKSSNKNKKNNTNNNNLSLNSPIISGEINPTVGAFPAGQTEFNGCDEIQIPGFLHSSATHSVIASQLGFGFGNDQLITNMVQKDHQQPPPVTLGPCTSLLLSEIMNVNNFDSSLNQNNPKENYESRGNLKMLDLDPQLGMNYPSGFSTSTHCNNIVPGTSSTSATVPSGISQLQGVGEVVRPERLTVFINEVAFEVASGPFNVRQAFGEDAVLISSSGQPIVTNEWGVTLDSLHHGALYYLI